ncbi:hypothetical protein K461DRAFT_323969 [Myriangium duriaei CBS 260.36]|uniref:Shugoshin C-terminal domain-containing protein n=1 Tax=Myriangium duriaei CBS 260.36 TaxID=1168546 RepID=A0A9P4IVX7_9PEZI|nr:hypothetical protein K461DRAFT_323969 [Myriangium duriaei CBS 260.36]
MARLNEAPPQTESLEALKRRFVRQNRDLARINTSQSLRIRSLEIEQSRLQTENLCLREEVLRLQNRLSDTLNDAQLPDLARVKNALEQQLAALGGVVAELGRFKRPEIEKLPADPSTWRPTVPNLHLAGGLEPRMPSILEDKSYPRRTLGGDEIRALRLSDHSNDSPDLGPPPVARFDCADPIKFDRSALKPMRAEDEQVEIPTELAVNLESRRKRRETTLRLMEAEPATETSESEPAQRSSAKRKLSVRDHEEPATTEVAEAHPFIFTRRSSSIPNMSGGQAEEEAVEKPTNDEIVEPVQLTATKERKILGEKSVNTSPRKVVVGKKSAKTMSKPLSTVETLDVTKTRARRPKSTSIPAPLIKEIEAPTIPSDPNAAVPPKTPSGSLFSPTPEPSTLPQETDQPTDPATAANLEGVRRPSRRSRAVQSYAEPSLNTKMRRPTKELIDAVVLKAATAGGRSTSTGAKIKPEPSDDEPDWRTLLAAEPGSPLSAKTGTTASESGSTVMRRADKGLEDRMRDLEVREPQPRIQTQRRSSLGASRRHSSVISGDEAREALSSSPSREREQELSAPPAVVNRPTAAAGSVMRIERATAGRRRSMMV